MAQSDSEAESVHSQTSVASPSQKFVPEDDDEETLWEVESITAEKNNQYKVKWVGLDPMTGKPWAQSWVPKKDCTPDLVLAWKLKKKEADRRKSTASTRGRSSIASRYSERASTASTIAPRASTSKLTDARRSTSTVYALAGEGDATTARRGRSSGIPLSTTSTTVSPAQTKGKSTKSKSKSKHAPDPIPEADAEVEFEEVTPAALKRNVKSMATTNSTTTMKGKKRKLDEAQSANNSARTPTVDVNVNAEDDNDEEPITTRVVPRPKKKRKVEVEMVKPKVAPVDDGEEEEDPRRSMSLSQRTRLLIAMREEEEETEEEESYPARRLRGKAIVSQQDEEPEEAVKREKDTVNEVDDSEEEEERMVEEVLSQGITTPPRNGHSHDRDSSVEIIDVGMTAGERDNRKGKGRKVEIDELADDDTAIIISKPPTKTKPTVGAGPTSKSTAKATASSPHKVGSPSRKSLPKSNAGPSALNAQSMPKSNARAQGKATTSTSIAKPTPKPPPRRQRMMVQERSFQPRRRGNTSESNDDNDKSDDNDNSDKPPPLFYPSSSPSRLRYRLPTEERSVFWERPRPGEGNRTVSDRDTLPDEERLTADDLTRLRQFDEDMKALEQEQEQELQKRGPPREEAGAVERPSGGVKPAKGGAVQPSPNSRQQQAVASSSKWKEGTEIINVDTESEKDQVVAGRQTMFVPDKSSALMKASSSKQVVERPRQESEPAHPTTAAVAREADEAEAHSTTSKSSKKTIGSSKSTSRTKQRVSKPPSNSYEHETIPETEAEESQSQEKEKARAREIDLTPPGPTAYPTLLQPPTPSTPGGRSTLKSKMRPKTPLSRASSMSVTGKPLGPIPQLTPSIFHPHLPVNREPASSLPESISDVVDSAKRSSSKISTQMDDGDVQMDAIEEFDSPQKPVRPTTGSGSRMNERREGSAEQIWESDVVKRGQEIAEAAKRRAAAEASMSGPRPKKTLEEIRTTHSRRSSNASNTNEARPGSGGLVHETIVEEDEEMQDLSTAAVPPGSGPRAALEDDSATLREMEEAYVDLNGGAGAEDDNPNSANVSQPLAPHIALRQEEEESTQDAAQTMMDNVVFQVSKTSSSENAVSQLVLGSEEASNDGGSENIPTIVVQDASRPASPRPYSDDGSQLGNMRTTRSRSRSQTPAVVPQTPKGRGKGKAKAATVDSRAGSLAPPSKVSSSTNHRHVEDVQDRLNSALALVETKSQELQKLETELVSQRTKNAEEVERHKALTERQQGYVAFSIAQFGDAQKEWKQQMAEADAKSSQLLAAKEAEWEAERARLFAQVEAATKSKESADKDRDFFREQYAQASGYVTSVREENKDLEKRIKIAEDQAQSGVALIKATFEMRVKNLETDLKSWRRMAEFLIEKDRRTDNDELRRRAAEYPELASRCDRQRHSMEILEEEIEDLKEDNDTRNREWAADKTNLELLKKETTRLNIEVNEALIKLDRIGRANDDDESGDANPSANEFVYCCQWRDYDGVESTPCGGVFSTISALEHHLLSGGHLHHT